MGHTNAARERMAEVFRLAARTPSPANGKVLGNFGIVMALLLGTPAGEAVARAYRDDFRARAERGAPGVPGERRRLLWIQNRIQFKHPLIELLEQDYGAVVVADEASQLPLGLVTLRELLHVITFEGGDLDAPVAAYMTGAPLTAAADSPAHRAKVLMAKKGVGHILLVEADGRFCGLVHQADLLGLRAGGAEVLIATIAATRDLKGMVLVADQVRRRGADLFNAGMGVEAICQWMSGLNDLIAMRVIELIEDEFDLPAVPWCWLLFGSEGRLEQTFTTDQDNGLAFEPSNPEDTEALRAVAYVTASAMDHARRHADPQLIDLTLESSDPLQIEQSEEDVLVFQQRCDRAVR